MPSEGHPSSVLCYDQTAARRRTACRFLLPLRKFTKPHAYYENRPFPKMKSSRRDSAVCFK